MLIETQQCRKRESRKKQQNMNGSFSYLSISVFVFNMCRSLPHLHCLLYLSGCVNRCASFSFFYIVTLLKPNEPSIERYKYFVWGIFFIHSAISNFLLGQMGSNHFIHCMCSHIFSFLAFIQHVPQIPAHQCSEE